MDHSPLHYYGYIFVGFANLTDNVFAPEEHRKIVELVCKLAGKDCSVGDFAILMAKIMAWYEEIDDLEKKEKEFMKHVRYVNQMEWLDQKGKEQFLINLVELALSDGNLVEKEFDWLNQIAKIWGVDARYGFLEED